jgi:hypothetical protein
MSTRRSGLTGIRTCQTPLFRPENLRQVQAM